METLPPSVQRHFTALKAAGRPIGPLGAILDGLADGSLTKAGRRRVLREAGVSEDESYRKAQLDMILSFLRESVEGGRFNAEAQRAFEALKELFDLREGELVRYRGVELAALLSAQLELILEDDIIDPAEDELQARLQDALDLGFDQYMALCRRAFENVSLRLQERLQRSHDPRDRAAIQGKLDALAPMIRLAEAQHRTPGALY